MNKSEVVRRLDELGVRPKRSLGQNFLINPGVVDRIIGVARQQGAERWIEIGPGLGALTEKIPPDVKTILVELDSRFSEVWRRRGFDVIEGDALKCDWLGRMDAPEKTLLLSNLPYQISASLVVELSVAPRRPRILILMFQREVGERIMAKPRSKSYGLLSVLAQLFWSIEVVLDLAPGDFYPRPEVASRVLMFVATEPSVRAPREFLRFIKGCFRYRRKMLLKNLAELGSKERAMVVLRDEGLGEKIRAEELSPQQFLSLFARWEAE